eukprot:14870784-Alexandrium_andersonii.AAC.1
MSASLVGSEMCIRDRGSPAASAPESDRSASRRDRSGAEADRPPAAVLRPAKETAEHARDYQR